MSAAAILFWGLVPLAMTAGAADDWDAERRLATLTLFTTPVVYIYLSKLMRGGQGLPANADDQRDVVALRAAE
jgi:hypothetical protein